MRSCGSFDISMPSAPCGISNIVHAVKKINNAVKMNASCPHSPMPSGTHHIPAKLIRTKRPPANIYGRRRPQRVRVLSERCPIMGSDTASQSRGKISITPSQNALSPKPILPIKPISCPAMLNNAIGMIPPLP